MEQLEIAKAAAGGSGAAIAEESDASDSEEEGEFYTEGPDELLQARRKIARYSLARCVHVSLIPCKECADLILSCRARTRLAKQRIEVGLPLGKIVNARKALYQELKVCLFRVMIMVMGH